VKIFPGSSVGGADFVKGVLGPLPYASIMPTGGVSPDEANLKTWFKAGVHCVGMGSQLFPKEVLESKDWAFITRKCSEALEIVSKIRTNQ
jgi:2-dehydro-3-deoxyphosphogluconate aldolase/(4S)-4-hydroxy-2-oxoglutarate aldolase